MQHQTEIQYQLPHPHTRTTTTVDAVDADFPGNVFGVHPPGILPIFGTVAADGFGSVPIDSRALFPPVTPKSMNSPGVFIMGIYTLHTSTLETYESLVDADGIGNCFGSDSRPIDILPLFGSLPFGAIDAGPPRVAKAYHTATTLVTIAPRRLR